MVTCIILQTLILVGLAQQRTGFFGVNPEVTWRGRVASILVAIFNISAVGAFANAGYLESLRRTFDAGSGNVAVYGDGFNAAATAIAVVIIQTALFFVFQPALKQVAEYYAALGPDASGPGGSIAAAAAGLASTDGGAAPPASSAYTTLTPEERARILGKEEGGEGGEEEVSGSYQGSSAYASL